MDKCLRLLKRGVLVATLCAIASAIVPALAPATALAAPKGQICDAYGTYTNTSHGGSDRFVGVSPTYHNYNGTGQYEDMTFTSSATGTVGVDVSVSATIDANAILAGAQLTTGVTLHTTLSVTTSNSITVKNVPPGVNVYAQYGVFQNNSYGNYTYYRSNCTVSYYGYVHGYVPDGIGWYTHN